MLRCPSLEETGLPYTKNLSESAVKSIPASLHDPVFSAPANSSRSFPEELGLPYIANPIESAVRVSQHRCMIRFFQHQQNPHDQRLAELKARSLAFWIQKGGGIKLVEGPEVRGIARRGGEGGFPFFDWQSLLRTVKSWNYDACFSFSSYFISFPPPPQLPPP